MGLTVVDASILIGVLTPGDTTHKAATAALSASAARHDIVIPVTVFSEVLVGPYRQSADRGREVEEELRRIGRVQDVTADIGRRAAQIRASRHVKLPDALVLATAQRLDGDEILTCDQRWRSLDPRVTLADAGSPDLTADSPAPQRDDPDPSEGKEHTQ